MQFGACIARETPGTRAESYSPNASELATCSVELLKAPHARPGGASGHFCGGVDGVTVSSSLSPPEVWATMTAGPRKSGGWRGEEQGHTVAAHPGSRSQRGPDLDTGRQERGLKR